MITDLSLMECHVNALFTHDAQGRLCSVNEPNGAPAPRFFLGRTTQGHICRMRFDLPDPFVSQLATACRCEPLGNLSMEPANIERYLSILEPDSPIGKIETALAYAFPINAGGDSPDVVPITADNIDVLRGGFGEWLPHVMYRQPFFAILLKGRAVSLCCSVRITPVAHEAGVETLYAYRGNGFAARVVAHWAKHVSGLGRLPLYSTSWKNSASRRVADKLRLRRYGITFKVQ